MDINGKDARDVEDALYAKRRVEVYDNFVALIEAKSQNMKNLSFKFSKLPYFLFVDIIEEASQVYAEIECGGFLYFNGIHWIDLLKRGDFVHLNSMEYYVNCEMSEDIMSRSVFTVEIDEDVSSSLEVSTSNNSVAPNGVFEFASFFDELNAMEEIDNGVIIRALDDIFKTKSSCLEKYLMIIENLSIDQLFEHRKLIDSFEEVLFGSNFPEFKELFWYCNYRIEVLEIITDSLMSTEEKLISFLRDNIMSIPFQLQIENETE